MPRISVTGHMNLTERTATLVRSEIDRLLQEYEPGDTTGISCIAAGTDTLFAQRSRIRMTSLHGTSGRRPRRLASSDLTGSQGDCLGERPFRHVVGQRAARSEVDALAQKFLEVVAQVQQRK